MKHYFSLINLEIPLGKGLNALAHTAIGVGHRLPDNQMPNITVLFADEGTIREFRQEALNLLQAYKYETVYSDFTHTMTVGSTDNCVKVTRETPENQLQYYAASICTEEKLLDSQKFDQILRRCKKLKNYKSHIASNNDNDFKFKDLVCLPDYQSLPSSKISLTLDRTRPLSELVNAAIISSFSISKQADLNRLKLIIYSDADQQEHPYISSHPFPILAARQQNKFNELAKIVEKDSNLLVGIVKDRDENVVSICMLGNEDQVNIHTKQKFISLWTAELHEEAFNSE